MGALDKPGYAVKVMLVCLQVLVLGASAWSEPSANGAAQSVAEEEPSSAMSSATADEEPTPTAAGSDEPAAAGSDEPAPPAAEPAAPPATPPPADSTATHYGVGVHVRAIFIPTWMLKLFLDKSTPVNSAALGLEVIRRKGNFDMIGSIDFGFYSPKDGNYLGKGDDPARQTDYVHFDNLNVLAFSLRFLRHEPILPWLSFVWGGGLGLGVVLGSVYRASSAGCTSDNVSDLNQCHPLGMDPAHPERWLADPANHGTKSQDSPADPKVFKEGGIPPVVPIVHLLVGANFKVSDTLNVRLDGGFQNAFYVGATGQYFF